MFGTRLRNGVLQACILLIAACSAATPESLMTAAREAFAAGDTRTAEIHLLNLLERDGDNVGARVFLSEVALAGGNPWLAERSARAALDRGAERGSVQLTLLQALFVQRKYPELIEASDAGPGLTGVDAATALLLRGAAKRAVGAPAEAEAAYRAALDLEPGSPRVQTDLAHLLVDTRRIDEAQQLIDASLAREPDFVPALLVDGELARRRGRQDLAEAAFGKAAELEQAGGRTSGEQYAVALSRLIETQLAQRKRADAEANTERLLAAQPQNPVARYLKATHEVEQNQLESAEIRLQGVIGEFPEFWPAYGLLGAVNATQNQPEQAAMYLRTAVDKNAADAAARVLLAQIYIKEGEVARARDLFSDVVNSSDGLLLAWAGRSVLMSGDSSLAAEYFDRSERDAPKDLDDLLRVSTVYVNSGEFERAVRFLETSSLEGEDADRLKSYLLTLIHLRQGEFAAAHEAASRLAEQEPNSAWPVNLRAAVALFAGDVEGAEKLYASALAIDPADTPALLNLARIALARGEPAAAAQYLRSVVEIDPEEVVALLGLAQLAIVGGEYSEARAWLDRVPDSALRSRLEGELYVAQRQFERAADAFIRAFDAEPSADLAIFAFAANSRTARPRPEAQLVVWTEQHPREVVGNFALGTVFLARGELEAAIARFDTVLEENPDHTGALNNLAWIHGERGDERALGFAQRAHDLAPDDPAIADTLGWIQVRAGAPERGLLLLERAAAALPNEPEVRYHWAVALDETNARSEALSVLEDLVGSDVEFKSRDAAVDRVRTLRAGRDPRVQ